MPEHDTIPHHDISLALQDLTARVRKLELENLQLRKENLFVQLQLTALERGHALDDRHHDAAVTWDQLRALRDRIESID